MKVTYDLVTKRNGNDERPNVVLYSGDDREDVIRHMKKYDREHGFTDLKIICKMVEEAGRMQEMLNLRKTFEETKLKCHWNKDMVCENDTNCETCKYQPPDDEKPNGKKEPRLIRWQEGCGGGIYPECPACGEMPYGMERCFFCGQRLIKDERAKEWEQPPEEVREDCVMCGGIRTVVGARARSNGHFHGKCEKCGAVYME